MPCVTAKKIAFPPSPRVTRSVHSAHDPPQKPGGTSSRLERSIAKLLSSNPSAEPAGIFETEPPVSVTAFRRVSCKVHVRPTVLRLAPHGGNRQSSTALSAHGSPLFVGASASAHGPVNYMKTAKYVQTHTSGIILFGVLQYCI